NGTRSSGFDGFWHDARIGLFFKAIGGVASLRPRTCVRVRERRSVKIRRNILNKCSSFTPYFVLHQFKFH
ncbi:hypothetical protein L9F63_014947, partial [Diploptera punctata]